MIKDITLGQYYSADSVIHKLDPRVKLRFSILYIILLLLDRNIPLFVMLTAIFVATVVISKVPVNYMIKGTKGVITLILVCSAICIFTTPGLTTYEIGILVISKEGIIKAAFVFWRMLLMLFMTSMLMYTTTPTQITDGLEKAFHLPASAAMGTTIALRFLGVLSKEMDRIMKAQISRGASFGEGGPVTRIKAMSRVIVPLFQNTIDRAANLGDAMDARCYRGGKGRTKLMPLHYEMLDFAIYIFMIVITIAGIYLTIHF